MTTRRAPFQTQWVKRDDPKPEPVSPRAEKAAHLEMFGPGIVITVPLHLLPEYLDLYSLQPTGIREPKVKPLYGPGEAILLVKRTPKDGQ